MHAWISYVLTVKLDGNGSRGRSSKIGVARPARQVRVVVISGEALERDAVYRHEIDLAVRTSNLPDFVARVDQLGAEKPRNPRLWSTCRSETSDTSSQCHHSVNLSYHQPVIFVIHKTIDKRANLVPEAEAESRRINFFHWLSKLKRICACNTLKSIIFSIEAYETWRDSGHSHFYSKVYFYH